MKKEAITHGVWADLANRNENWEKLDGVPEKVDLLTDELGLIKDYVIESDPNRNWEKWESGKFVQRGFYNSVMPVNITLGGGYRAAEAIEFGFPFLAGSFPHVVATSANYVNVSVQSTAATNFQVGYTSFDSGRQASGIRYVATGRWK